MNKQPRFFYSLFLITGLISIVSGQTTSKITLDDIYRSQKFSARGLDGLESMKDGLHYTVQNHTRINKYSYSTGEITELLFDCSGFNELRQFTGYWFNDSEDKILLETEQEQIYLMEI